MKTLRALGLVALGLLGAVGNGWAAPAVGPSGFDQLQLLDTGKGRFIVASAPSGMVLLDDKLEVYRVYRYAPLAKKGSTAPERMLVVDLDGDEKSELIGIGKPTFGLDPTGNPLWDFPDGCTELVTGDLLGTPEKEVACVHGRALSTLAVDGSPVWHVELSSSNMTGLASGMLQTTDGKEGLEFNVGREVLRFAGNGTPLPGEFTERLTEPVDRAKLQAEQRAALAAGQTPVELGDDGAADDTLTVSGNVLAIRLNGSAQPSAEYTSTAGPILGLGVAPGFGPDGKSLILVGGDRRVVLLGTDGRVVKELALDLTRAQRASKVELVGANAVGFELREAVEKQIQATVGELGGCYERRHKAYSLTRQGKTMFKFDVGDNGRVKGSELLYTTLNDAEVNGCIVKAVSKLALPKPSEPGAHVTADVLFTWTDSFR